MTTETQTFIPPQDIKGFRFECLSCHTKTIVSLQDERSRDQAKTLCTRFQCPHCKSEWFSQKDGSYLDLLAKFVDAIVAMQERENPSMVMMLEVTPSASQT